MAINGSPKANPGVKKGNRTSYDGSEMLAILWALEEFSDEDHPLTWQKIRELACSHLGEEKVPEKQKFQNRIKALCEWSRVEAKHGRFASKEAPYPREVPVVDTRIQDGRRVYFVRRHRNEDAENRFILNAAMAMSLGGADAKPIAELADCDFELLLREVKAKADAAEKDMPVANDRRTAVEELAVMLRLQRAIEKKHPITFDELYFYPVKQPRSGNDKSRGVLFGARTGEAVNHHRTYIWPYKLVFMDGDCYLLTNGTGKRRGGKIAPTPVSRIVNLRVLDPSEPIEELDAKGNSKVIHIANRPDRESLIPEYLDGAVLGFGSTAPKEHITLMCKGEGLSDACARFGNFDNFKVYKGKRAGDFDEAEKAARPNAKKSRKYESWFQVEFDAHPHGVSLWAKQRFRDVVFFVDGGDQKQRRESIVAERQIKNDLRNVRYDLGDWYWTKKFIEEVADKADPLDLCDVGELREEERRVLAAYRNYVAEKDE